MTIKALFDKKYREFLKTMSKNEWKDIQQQSQNKKMHPADIIYWLYLKITWNDIKDISRDDEFWKEWANKAGLIKSWENRYNTTCYSLTLKGLKQIKGLEVNTQPIKA